MPLEFHYDRENRILHGVASGVLTALDFATTKLPAYPIGTPELFDARAVTAVELGAEDIRRLAYEELRGPNRISRMAVVSSRDTVFGLARMFQGLADEVAYGIRVFRDHADAVAWLAEVPPPAESD